MLVRVSGAMHKCSDTVGSAFVIHKVILATTHPSGRAHGNDGDERQAPQASGFCVGHMLTAVANFLGAGDCLEKSNESRESPPGKLNIYSGQCACVHNFRGLTTLKTQAGLPQAGPAHPPPGTPSHPLPVPVASRPEGEPRTDTSGTRR